MSHTIRKRCEKCGNFVWVRPRVRRCKLTNPKWNSSAYCCWGKLTAAPIAKTPPKPIKLITPKTEDPPMLTKDKMAEIVGAVAAKSPQVQRLRVKRDGHLAKAREWERRLALAVTKLRYYNQAARRLDATIEQRLAGVPPKPKAAKKTRKIKVLDTPEP